MARGCPRHGVKERGAREGRGGAKQEPKESHHGGGPDDEASEAEIVYVGKRKHLAETTPGGKAIKWVSKKGKGSVP